MSESTPTPKPKFDPTMKVPECLTADEGRALRAILPLTTLGEMYDGTKSVEEGADLLTVLARAVQRLGREIDGRNELKLLKMSADATGIDLSVGGENASIFAAILAEFFDQNGAKNFLTTTIEVITKAKPTDSRGMRKLELTVRDVGIGRTPAMEIHDLKEKVAALEAELKRHRERAEATWDQ